MRVVESYKNFFIALWGNIKSVKGSVQVLAWLLTLFAILFAVDLQPDLSIAILVIGSLLLFLEAARRTWQQMVDDLAETKDDKITFEKLDYQQQLLLKVYKESQSKQLVIRSSNAGPELHLNFDLADAGLDTEISKIEGSEIKAQLDDLCRLGIVDHDKNRKGADVYPLAKPGYDLLKSK